MTDKQQTTNKQDEKPDDFELLREYVCHLWNMIAKGTFPGSLPEEKQVAEALAALERIKERTQWRPIAEAPKDGTPSLLFYPNSHPSWRNFHFGDWSSGFFDGRSWQTGNISLATKNPTHFRPLPEPPKEKP